MSAKAALFVVLATVTVAFIAFWLACAAKWDGSLMPVAGHRRGDRLLRHAGDWIVRDDVVDVVKLGLVVDDARIPGTLNVGHTIPTFVQAFIFIAVVEVNVTLVMIGAAVAGAWLGAGFVSRWPKRASRSAWACCCSWRRASSSALYEHELNEYIAVLLDLAVRKTADTRAAFTEVRSKGGFDLAVGT